VDTVLQSRSSTVVIGPEQPFCIIGERINPTGRKAFQAELQAGDLSRIEVDVAEQIAGGADMLDVNVGDPLADEVGLMGQAIPLVQGLTDVPLCIDSSVIEALEAGLASYDGKALVGAKIAALSVQERAAASAIVDEVEYVELSGRADFNDLFIDQLAFPA
jgi:5-methyltetrahydrofolate--homocysteine methyltransferase